MNTSILTDAIRDYGSAKQVARVIGCSEITAARYRRGESTPNALGLARLMAHSRSVANAMLRLAGLDDLSLDLEEARLTQDLHALQARRAEMRDAPAEAGAPRAEGAVARLRERMADRALEGMSRALDEAKRLR